MLIRISMDEWLNDISNLADVHKAGQETDGSIIYAIVPDGTSTTGEVLNDMPKNIMQEIHPGRFGEYMDLSTIEEISAIKNSIGEVTFDECDTLNELRMAESMVTNALMIDYLAGIVLGGE